MSSHFKINYHICTIPLFVLFQLLIDSGLDLSPKGKHIYLLTHYDWFMFLYYIELNTFNMSVKGIIWWTYLHYAHIVVQTRPAGECVEIYTPNQVYLGIISHFRTFAINV